MAKREDIALVAAAIEANPSLEITVDVKGPSIRYGSASIPRDHPVSRLATR